MDMRLISCVGGATQCRLHLSIVTASFTAFITLDPGVYTLSLCN